MGPTPQLADCRDEKPPFFPYLVVREYAITAVLSFFCVAREKRAVSAQGGQA